MQIFGESFYRIINYIQRFLVMMHIFGESFNRIINIVYILRHVLELEGK